MDSNGDGIGDFEGLSRRLDYLAGLGITCIWLQPFQPSPYRDSGYDIADYYGVDPRYGSPGDFVDFANQGQRKECPELGWGDYAILNTRSSSVLAVHYEWRNNALVTLHNFHEKPVTVSLTLKDKSGDRLMNLCSAEHSQAGPDGYT